MNSKMMEIQERLKQALINKVEKMLPTTAPFEDSISPIAGDILFIGYGRCGGAITNVMQRKGFKTMYMNTSLGDFQNLLKVDRRMIYQITNGSGCDKNRDLSLELAYNDRNKIAKHIKGNYSTFKHFVFIHSAGGGTGSAGAPAMAEYLAKEHGLSTSLITVLNAKSEGKPATKNSLECIQQIYNDCPNVRSKFILDNNLLDSKTEVNKQFANIIENFMFLPIVQPDIDDFKVKGCDETELLGLWAVEGFVGIGKLNAPNPNAAEGDKQPYHIDTKLPFMAEIYHDEELPVQMAVSISSKHQEDFSSTQLRKKFNVMGDIKVGYNKTDETYMFVFGLPHCNAIPQRLDSWLDDFEREERKIKELNSVYVPKERTTDTNKVDKRKEEADVFGTVSEKSTAGLTEEELLLLEMEDLFS